MEQSTPLNPIPSQGPVVGIIIVIIVLVVGAFFFFGRLSTVPAPIDVATTSDTAAFPPTATSDEPVAIQNDLDAESFESLDAELHALDAELQ